eukprot:4182971-Amphidinium_carterae.1
MFWNALTLIPDGSNLRRYSEPNPQVLVHSILTLHELSFRAVKRAKASCCGLEGRKHFSGVGDAWRGAPRASH